MQKFMMCLGSQPWLVDETCNKVGRKGLVAPYVHVGANPALSRQNLWEVAERHVCLFQIFMDT